MKTRLDMRRIAIGSSLVAALLALLVMAPSCGGNTITPPASTGTGGSSTGTGGAHNPGTGGQGGDAGMVLTGGAAGQGGNAGSTSAGGAAGQAGNPSTGGAAGQGGGPSPTACVVSDDCTWGEIPDEITKPSDCTCLYGCPYIAQNKTTVMRRNQQYTMFCSPHVDGKGNPCGIDDCVVPPKAACIDGMCTRAPSDGGTL